jgi:hypothetical protein
MPNTVSTTAVDVSKIQKQVDNLVCNGLNKAQSEMIIDKLNLLKKISAKNTEFRQSACDVIDQLALAVDALQQARSRCSDKHFKLIKDKFLMALDTTIDNITNNESPEVLNCYRRNLKSCNDVLENAVQLLAQDDKTQTVTPTDGRQTPGLAEDDVINALAMRNNPSAAKHLERIALARDAWKQLSELSAENNATKSAVKGVIKKLVNEPSKNLINACQHLKVIQSGIKVTKDTETAYKSGAINESEKNHYIQKTLSIMHAPKKQAIKSLHQDAKQMANVGALKKSLFRFVGLAVSCLGKLFGSESVKLSGLFMKRRQSAMSAQQQTLKSDLKALKQEFTQGMKIIEGQRLAPAL